MGLFSTAQLDKINQIAAKSKELAAPPKSTTRKNITAEINEMSQQVIDYFTDSPAILIESIEQLHDYITEAIASGYCGIDTETTGLDRIHDTIVGASLYYPGSAECYIPMKHLMPIFDEPYKNQFTYEAVGAEFQRLADSDIRLIFANADFDLAMIYKDLKVDLNDRCYYDVILAWRCLKENELDNSLKGLYNKYVLKGKGDPKKFSDFFTAQLFPYCKPEVAKLYAANDAKITYELFKWQLPYVTKDHPKCKKAHLEKIADLVWNVEFPLISVCQNMHRIGMYIDKTTTRVLLDRYHQLESFEKSKLASMVDEELSKSTTISAFSKKPFTSGSNFNPKSPPHVKYLLYTVMNLPQGKNGGSTDKNVLSEMNLPIANQILKVRSLGVLISTFVEKLPNATTSDSRIHARFSSVGADTGRLSCISKGTSISCPGGDKPIQELQIGDYVYCYDVDTCKLQLSTVEGVYFTGVRKCVKLHWRSKYNSKLTGELICTPDHFIRTVNRGWVQAQDLTSEDSILYVHRREDANSTALYGMYGQGNEEEHAWVKHYMYPDLDSNSYQIHHIDKDRHNNDPRNLACLTPKQHTAAHLCDASEHHCGSNKYSYDELVKMCEDAHWELSKVPMDFTSLLNNLESYRINYILKYTESYSERPWIKNRQGSYKKAHMQFTKRGCAYALNLANGDLSIAASYYGVPVDVFIEKCEHFELLSNHNVTSIEWLDAPFDVYDITVKGYHNFIAGELCVHNSSEPNVMNIPSHATDIRHMFRATPGYVMLSSDYSRQEPAITAFVSGDKGMLDSFIQDRDIYASIASLAFNVPYEKCLEFHPDTHEYQPDGKARRGEAKTILLGISYGRAIPSIAEQLYNTRDDMTDEEKIKGAQKVYDSVMNAFPGLRRIMNASQKFVIQHGYTETILGRRRHLPDMQLPEFEFMPLAGYVNPDIDPLDPTTLQNKSDIPDRVKASLLKELKGYKYFGQVANRMRQLHDDEHIKVINNRSKIQDATRQILNSIIQGSAADMSKLAILNLCNDPDWKRIGGRLLTPIHDELCCEVPIEHWEEGGKILSRCMIEAASFLPFNMTCDVTTTLRWYGLEFPCKYPKPEHLTDLSPEHIKWVQYQLYENEYTLPVYKDENGDKPRGDAALGVNGVESDEYFAAIKDYKHRYHIETDEQFIEHIERKVIYNEY